MTASLIQTQFGAVREGWPLSPLAKYTFFQEGPGLRQWQWTQSGMKVINGKNILSNGEIDLANTVRYISNEEFRTRYSHFAVQPDDIVVVSSGSIGKVGRIKPEHLPLMMNTSVIRFHPYDKDRLDANFLYGFLRSPLFQRQAASFAIGAAQLNFGPVHLKQMWIPLPSIEVQRRVGTILSAYDELIENNTRRIAILQEMAHSLYREWFVHFRFPGHETTPMLESGGVRIPQGWRIGLFSDVATFSRVGVNPADCPEETFEHFSIPAFDDGQMPVIESGVGIRSSKYLLSNESVVLLSKLNPRIPRVWLAIPSGAHRAIASTEFLVLKPTERFITTYLLSLCRSTEFLGQFAGLSVGTSTSHQRAKPEDMLRLQLALPPESLVTAFGLKADPTLRLAHVLRVKNSVLRKTRDLLLPRLISGEVDVSDLDIDEGEMTA
jgi:type I restriction enzyme, S subunit